MFGWTRAEVMGRELADADHSRARARRTSQRHAPLRGIRRRARAQQTHRNVGAASRRARISGGAGDHAHRLRRRARVQRVHPRHHRPHSRRGRAARERAAFSHHGERRAGAHLDERHGQALHLVQPALARFRRPRHRTGDRRRLVRQPASGRLRSHAGHLSRRVRCAPARTKWSSACSATTAPGAGCSNAARRISGRTAISSATSAPASTSPSTAKPSSSCARTARASRRWRSPCRR